MCTVYIIQLVYIIEVYVIEQYIWLNGSRDTPGPHVVALLGELTHALVLIAPVSVLQCVAECCSVLQSVAECCRVL